MLETRVYPREYPWDRWTDGELHEAIWGKDFSVELPTFQHHLRARAKQEGLRVRTRLMTSRVVWFRFAEGRIHPDSMYGEVVERVASKESEPAPRPS